MPAAPFPPGGRDHRPRVQLQVAAGELANHRDPLERVPQALRLVVEHQLVRAVQEPARAERQMPAVRHALERDHRPAQRAVDDGQLDPAQPVERHLMPGQDAFRIGPRLAVGRDAEHDVIVGQVVGLGGLEPRWILERRDPVDRHAAPFDLVETDERRNAPREELGEARIDLAVPLPLEEAVIGGADRTVATRSTAASPPNPRRSVAPSAPAGIRSARRSGRTPGSAAAAAKPGPRRCRRRRRATGRRAPGTPLWPAARRASRCRGTVGCPGDRSARPAGERRGPSERERGIRRRARVGRRHVSRDTSWRLQVFGRQSGPARDPGQHPGADLVPFVESERVRLFFVDGFFAYS